MKLIICLVLLSCLLSTLPTLVSAQSGTSVLTGTVVDRSSKLPIEFATLQLLNPGDSAVISTTVTDRKGKFSIEKIKPGKYIFLCSFIGYEKNIIPFTVNQARENLGSIEIGLLTKDMKEVVVTSRKSLLNTSIDRKIYNVTQDIMAQSGSASDILRNIPSVEVDIEGQVTLRGAGDVMILINGRPSPLMGKSRAEVLQQIPANTIERIEVITNPSARYKPDGNAGIINIVMKKNAKGGWTGSLIGNIGNKSRVNGSLNLNYKPGKLNLFSNYSIRQDRRLRTNNIQRQYMDGSGQITSYYTENNQSPVRPLSHFVTLGMEDELNEHNSIGLSGNYHYRDQVRNDMTNKFYYDKNHLLITDYDRLRYDPEYEKEKDVTAFWEHRFPKEDHELRAELNVSSSDEKEDNHYTNAFHFPVKPSSMDNTVIRQTDNQQELTFDYSNPLSEDSKLEAGYDGSFNQRNLDFYGEYYDTVLHRFVKDMTVSNRFTYHEAIHAFYGTWQHSYEKFGYELGLRFEEAIIRGRLVTKDSSIRNNYFKTYPTIHLSYKIKKLEWQLNYSKRVNRPEGDDLNPFPEYQDPNNLRAGNPKLLPEITHSVEFGFKWQNDKYSIVPSLYYRHRRHGFTSVTIPLNDSVLLTTQQNLSNDQSAGLELIFSAKAGKNISITLSSNFFYNTIDATNLGYSNNRSIISMSTNFNSTVTLSPTTLLQVSCNFRSARLTPQGKIFGSFVLNTGMRQDLFKKKVSLTLTVSDLFNSLKQRSELNSAFINQVVVGRRDARIVYFGVSWRFGKLVKKNNEEKLQFDNSL
ncbi:MAG TPA: outer membrane beta-barrel family protein [Chitinophagaceae bacterium]|nr:outer membrane beta-barrel family protein [Chitinophagaceae bacterium]